MCEQFSVSEDSNEELPDCFLTKRKLGRHPSRRQLYASSSSDEELEVVTAKRRKL